MAIEMELSRVLIRETDDTHVVELKEKDGTRVFPIMIGLLEASAIERRLMKHTPPRPQTHELLDNIVQALGYRIDRVIINDLKDHTFFARLILVPDDPEMDAMDMDARPSDAIALGCASGAPIYVAEHVLAAACEPELDDEFELD